MVNEKPCKVYKLQPTKRKHHDPDSDLNQIFEKETRSTTLKGGFIFGLWLISLAFYMYFMVSMIDTVSKLPQIYLLNSENQRFSPVILSPAEP